MAHEGQHQALWRPNSSQCTVAPGKVLEVSTFGLQDQDEAIDDDRYARLEKLIV